MPKGNSEVPIGEIIREFSERKPAVSSQFHNRPRVGYQLSALHRYAAPEGIINTLTAIVTALLFCAGELWSLWMPLNKNLWSPSFTFVMAGIDFIILAAALWLVDVRGYKKIVKPLLIVGMNSIAVYLASEVLAELLDDIHIGREGASLHDLLYNGFFAPLASVENASLLWALAFTLLMYLWAYFLYKKSWFWRI